MKPAMLLILGFYRAWISPAIHAVFPGACGFRPTCSQYAAEAIAIWGPWRGGRLALKRLVRCNPFTRGGFDPVPFPAPQARHASSTAHDPLP